MCVCVLSLHALRGKWACSNAASPEKRVRSLSACLPHWLCLRFPSVVLMRHPHNKHGNIWRTATEYARSLAFGLRIGNYSSFQIGQNDDSHYSWRSPLAVRGRPLPPNALRVRVQRREALASDDRSRIPLQVRLPCWPIDLCFTATGILPRR